MPDSPGSGKDISAIYSERRKTRDMEISLYSQVEAAIRGETPPEYENLFTETDVRLQLRTIRSADDSLTKFLSEIPIMPHVPHLGKRDTDKARDKAELAERIVQGYHNGSAMRGGVEFDGITFQLARHTVRFQDAVVLVHPDFDRKLVWLEAKHPACHFPPTGWSPWSPVPLDGTLLVYQMTLGEVKRRFAYDSYGSAKSDVLMRLHNTYAKSSGFGRNASTDDGVIVKVGVWRSRDAWFIVCLGDTDIVLSESHPGDKRRDGSPAHPGVCGVVSLKHFDSEPLFLGQIGIEAGAIKVLNQQIQNTERINKATTFGPPLLKEEVIAGGYNEINMALLQGRSAQFYRNAPESPSNLNQVLGMLLGLAEKYNYSPESTLGQGPAVSGKAIQQLQAGPRALVTNILFAPYKPAFPRVYDDCMDMELNLWPNERKTASGRDGKQSFEVDYTPSAALEGFKGRIRIEDARPAGYNAFLEEVQKKDAGLSDLLSVLERDPDVDNVQETYRRIQAMETGAFLKAAFEGLGASDPLRGMQLSAELLKRINSGKSRDDAIQDMLTEGLLEPPAPEAVPGAPGGLPPELMAAMGGGAPEGPLPSLAEARGYA